MADPHVAYQPLLDYIVERYGEVTHGQVASLCNVSRKTVVNWTTRGLGMYVADHAAMTGLGVHPEQIWGTEWTSIEIDVMKCLDHQARRTIKRQARASGRDPRDCAAELLAAC